MDNENQKSGLVLVAPPVSSDNSLKKGICLTLVNS